MHEKMLHFLSKRFNSENALSDITWAYAKANNRFKCIFLKFFFNEFSENESIIAFNREYVRDNCRPDFYIETDKNEYIIECKKYDRSHHFDQYPKSFPKSRFGYIANYKITGQNNIELRTWGEFYNEIQKTFLVINSDEEKIFFNSYMVYLKNVCNIIEIRHMKLNNINSLIHLNYTIRKILNELEWLDEIEFDGKVRNIDDYRYGKYYGIKKVGSQNKIWPWIGLYFNENRVMLYVEINKEWCDSAFEYINSLNEEIKDGLYYLKPYFDDDYRTAFAFELKEDIFSEFNLLTDVSGQEQIIKNFITEVLQLIDNYY